MIRDRDTNFHRTFFMAIDFNLELSWSQVSLFDANLTDPFNDWSEGHLNQGFSWRPGSVSFKLPTRTGGLEVTVDFIDSLNLMSEARWAIVVPFHTWAGVIEISTMSQSELVEIPAGRFALLYQTGIRDGRAWAHFGLLALNGTEIEPRVLRGDDVVLADAPILMEAEPAV